MTQTGRMASISLGVPTKNDGTITLVLLTDLQAHADICHLPPREVIAELRKAGEAIAAIAASRPGIRE